MIIGALSFFTEVERVSLIASRALTSSCRSGWSTLSIGSTRTWIARIWFLITTLDCVRHGYVSWKALAYWVAPSVNLTEGIASAWRWVTWIRRRGSNLNPDTTCNCVRLWSISGHTSAHRISTPVHFTLGVGSTRSGITWVWSRTALVSLANVTGTTICIPFTFMGTASDGVRLGNVGWQASADRVATSCHSALSIRTTGTWITRIRLYNTPLVLAYVTRLTVRINSALGTASSDCVRFRDQPRLTTTKWVTLEIDSADGSLAARRRVAWVRLLHTLLIFTNVSRRTVWIPDTLRSTSGDCVRIGDESWFTPADCVAIAGNRTHCSRTTWSRGAWIGLFDTSLIFADVT